MTNEIPSNPEDRKAEIEGALEALKRAGVRAEELATATGTALIFWQDGRTVRVEPRAKVRGPSGESKVPR